MISIRGATTVNNDSKEEILSNTKILLENIIKANKLDMNKITAIFFTCTRDLVSAYPAPAARDLGITEASLMCMQEMYVEGSLDKCIRVSVLYIRDALQSQVKHIYLNNAVGLRQDITNI